MKVLLTILIIGLLLFSACGTLNSERQEIISFTRQALEIEGKRNELMAYFASLLDKYGPFGAAWAMELFLLGGVPTTAFPKDPPPSDLEGMASFRNKILLLDCPQSMQSIKDALDHIYNSEVELAELEFRHDEEYPLRVPFFLKNGTRFVLPEVNQYNIELWQEKQFPTASSFMEHPWVELQLLRRDVYTRWVKILQEHDIDLLEEGFTSLIEYLN